MRLLTRLRPALCIIVGLSGAGGLWGTANAQSHGLLSRAPDAKMVKDVGIYTDYQRRQWQRQVRETHADFKFSSAVPLPLDPIPFADRTFRFESDFDDEGAYVAVHEPQGGAIVATCQMPCDITLDKSRDYVVSAATRGSKPYLMGFSPATWEAAKTRYPIYFGMNFVAHMERAKACYEAHIEAGRPDQEAVACVRVPPTMPETATRSGHCKMMFDVAETGWPSNVRAISCTEEQYRRPAVGSVKWWYYTPKTQRGQFVTQTNVESTVSFRLTNMDGQIIGEDGRAKEASHDDK